MMNVTKTGTAGTSVAWPPRARRPGGPGSDAVDAIGEALTGDSRISFEDIGRTAARATSRRPFSHARRCTAVEWPELHSSETEHAAEVCPAFCALSRLPGRLLVSCACTSSDDWPEGWTWCERCGEPQAREPGLRAPQPLRRGCHIDGCSYGARHCRHSRQMIEWRHVAS